MDEYVKVSYDLGKINSRGCNTILIIKTSLLDNLMKFVFEKEDTRNEHFSLLN